MKMHAIGLVSVIPVLLLALCSSGQTAGQVAKRDFWVVDLFGAEKISTHQGDMILVKTQTYPLIPANLKKTFELAFDRQHLKLVAEEGPEGEGRMGKQYYFVTLQPGDCEIRVTVRDQGKEVESFRLSVAVG